MKRRTLAVLFLLALASGLYIHFGVIKKLEREAEGTGGGEFFSALPEFYERLHIIQARGEEIELHRDGSRWFVRSPIDDLASNKTMEQVLNALRAFEIESVLLSREELLRRAQDLEQYGLESPRLVIAAYPTGGGEPKSIRLGNKNPAGTETYALDPTSGDLVLASQNLEFMSSYQADDYREHRLITVEAEDFSEVKMKVKDQKDIRFVREGEQWRMTEPEDLPLDQDFTRNQMSRLAILRATEFSDEKSIPRPQIEIEIGFKEGVVDRRVDENDSRPQGALIQLARQAKKGASKDLAEADRFNYYGKSDKSPIASIARFHYDNFSKDYRAYIKKSFDDFADDQIEEIEMKQFGETRWVLKKLASGWQWEGNAEDAPLPSTEQVEVALRSLRNIQAEHFMTRLSEIPSEKSEWHIRLKSKNGEAIEFAFSEHPNHQELSYQNGDKLLKYSLRERTFDPTVWNWAAQTEEPEPLSEETL